MASLTIAEVAHFIKRYDAFTTMLTDFRLQEFKSGFCQLKTSVKHIRTLTEESDKQHAHRFNIFWLLGVAGREVETHSALIADLLNPDGSHGQKYLFLNAFLQMCKAKDPAFPVPADDVAGSIWFLEKEKVVPYGRLDLMAACPGLKFLMVIENKIGAPEQGDQLERYADWMASRADLYTSQVLIYLTPTGAESHTNAGCPYFRLSYHRDIRRWLNSCLADIRATKVKEDVAQYVEVIQRL